MNQCYDQGDFKKYFDENMKELGAPVPTTLFDSYQTAIGTATTIVGTLHKIGKGATVAELVGATVGLEKLMIVGAFGAAAYTGIIIGSIAVASGRSLACGSRMSDMFVFIHQNNLEFDGWQAFYTHNPQILDKTSSTRYIAGMRAKNSLGNFSYS